MNKNSKIFIAGHKGLVGSAILRKLSLYGYKKIVVANKSKLDLTNQNKVFSFLKKEKPDFIFIAAAKVEVFFQTINIKPILFMKICDTK